MTKHLNDARPEISCARPKHRRNCWSPERRARQAARIREWAPWRRSTGPKTEAGKARCSKNALKHGYRSRASKERFRRIRAAIRLAARTLQTVKLMDRMARERARPQLKYKPWYIAARRHVPRSPDDDRSRIAAREVKAL